MPVLSRAAAQEPTALETGRPDAPVRRRRFMSSASRQAVDPQGHQPGGLRRAAHRQQRGSSRRSGEPRRPAAQRL